MAALPTQAIVRMNEINRRVLLVVPSGTSFHTFFRGVADAWRETGGDLAVAAGPDLPGQTTDWPESLEALCCGATAGGRRDSLESRRRSCPFCCRCSGSSCRQVGRQQLPPALGWDFSWIAHVDRRRAIGRITANRCGRRVGRTTHGHRLRAQSRRCRCDAGNPACESSSCCRIERRWV